MEEKIKRHLKHEKEKTIIFELKLPVQESHWSKIKSKLGHLWREIDDC